MPAIRRGINGLLNEFASLVPVDPELIPTIFSQLSTTLQPTIGFNPAPLAAKTIRLEMFALTVTLGGGETGFTFTTGVAVPRGEVHRYWSVGVSHTNAVGRVIRLIERYQLFGSAAVFSSVAKRANSIGPNLRIDLLQTDANGDFIGQPLDLWPGGSIQVSNLDVFVATDIITVQGWRQILVGPDLRAPTDQSADFTLVSA